MTQHWTDHPAVTLLIRDRDETRVEVERLRSLLSEVATEAGWVDPEPDGYSDVTLEDDLIVRIRDVLAAHEEGAS